MLIYNDAEIRSKAIAKAIVYARKRILPDEFAEILGFSRRELNLILRDGKLPSVNQLLVWGKLVVAAIDLECDGIVADDVAKQLRFPSPSAFRNTCKRYLGCKPHEIRTRGGAVWVVEKLKAPDE
jgi:AraC-like DNA-binding protein